MALGHDAGRPKPRGGWRRALAARPALLLGFAFAVMGDPVSSVAYAIEAALRALGGNLALLLPTMGLVVALVALVVASYHQLVARFPQGGGAAAAAAAAFGEGWAFLPIGALVVDFVLTIAISVAAAASALIAYLPSLAPFRLLLALGLLALVAGVSWFGHGSRLLFAAMTLAFVAIGATVLAVGFLTAAAAAVPAAPPTPGAPAAGWAILLAFPVGMALATGVEAPSSAIAQLGQLDDAGRRRFGRITLWLTLGVVGGLTLGLTGLAVRRGIGLPSADSTQIADVARAVSGPGPLFVAFQLSSALLLLAAASSSFQAGPGLLKALAADGGILPPPFGRTNAHHTPYWGVVGFGLTATLVVGAAGARDQVLVLFYAVAVFVAFVAGLLAMTAFAWRERRPGAIVLNAAGALAVALTLGVNLLRGWPLLSLAAAGLVAGGLALRWARAGRPRGIAAAESQMEAGLVD